MSTPLYLIQTPRAGALGHRFVLPPALSGEGGAAMARHYCALASQSPEGHNYLAVVHPKVQDVATGAMRSGNEILVVVGIATAALSPAEKRQLRELLERRINDMERLVMKTIDWTDSGQSSAIVRPELADWAAEDRLYQFPALPYQGSSEKMGDKPQSKERGTHTFLKLLCGLVFFGLLVAVGSVWRKSIFEDAIQAVTSVKDDTSKNRRELWQACDLSSEKELRERLKCLTDDPTEVPFETAKGAYNPSNSTIKPFVFIKGIERQNVADLAGFLGLRQTGDSVSLETVMTARKRLSELLKSCDEVFNQSSALEKGYSESRDKVRYAVEELKDVLNDPGLPFFITKDYEGYELCKVFLTELKDILDIPDAKLDYENFKLKLRAGKELGGCGLSDDNRFLACLQDVVSRWNAISPENTPW